MPVEVLTIYDKVTIEEAFAGVEVLGLYNLRGEGTSLTFEEFEFIAKFLPYLSADLAQLLFGDDQQDVPLAPYQHELEEIPANVTHFYCDQAHGINKLDLSKNVLLTHLALAYLAPIGQIEFHSTMPRISHLLTTSQHDFTIPPSVTHLTVLMNSPCGFTQFKHTPPSLTHLSLGFFFNQELQNVPSSVTHLNFGHSFNHDLPPLPSPLKCLTMSHCFNLPLPILPPALKILTLGANFNHIVESLPPDLTHLVFGDAFNQPLPALPSRPNRLIFWAIQFLLGLSLKIKLDKLYMLCHGRLRRKNGIKQGKYKIVFPIFHTKTP